MTASAVGIGYLAGMLGLIAAGALIPVVPTGAAVSVAAALAGWGDPLLIALVVGFGATGAYLGDLALYAGFALAARGAAGGSGAAARWITRQARSPVLVRLGGQLDHHSLRALVLSRLVPGGQIPVLVVAASSGYSWRRYAMVDPWAAGLWALMYALSGLAGRAVFPQPWEGAAAGVGIVLLISALGAGWHRFQRSS